METRSMFRRSTSRSPDRAARQPSANAANPHGMPLPPRGPARRRTGLAQVALIAVIASSTLAVGTLAARTMRPSPPSLAATTAGGVRIIDGSGATRALLRMFSGVPVLQLVDESGVPRLTMGLRLDGTPFIDLAGADGHSRLSLSAADADGAMVVRDVDGVTRFRLE